MPRLQRHVLHEPFRVYTESIHKSIQILKDGVKKLQINDENDWFDGLSKNILTDKEQLYNCITV